MLYQANPTLTSNNRGRITLANIITWGYADDVSGPILTYSSFVFGDWLKYLPLVMLWLSKISIRSSTKYEKITFIIFFFSLNRNNYNFFQKYFVVLSDCFWHIFALNFWFFASCKRFLTDDRSHADIKFCISFCHCSMKHNSNTAFIIVFCFFS